MKYEIYCTQIVTNIATIQVALLYSGAGRLVPLVQFSSLHHSGEEINQIVLHVIQYKGGCKNDYHYPSGHLCFISGSLNFTPKHSIVELSSFDLIKNEAHALLHFT